MSTENEATPKPIDWANLGERELREQSAPWFETIKELSDFIELMVKRSHDYGSVTYAMSLCAEATFNYVAHAQGCTGFQASAAGLNLIASLRGQKNGLMILHGDDLLYPQYDLRQKVNEWIEETEERLSKVALEKLAEEGPGAHPDVRRRWLKLSLLAPLTEPSKV